MRIQAKLFFLLVVIAILPLIALSWRSQVATERLGMAIADRGRVAVASQVEAQLRQAVSLGATILFQEQRLVELTLRMQAAEVERRLDKARVASPGPIYFSEDYADRSSWPPGTALSAEHFRLNSDETSEPVPTSLDHQSFFLPAGTDRNRVAPELLRLSDMTEVYRLLEVENEQLIFWQYTALESGIHSVYPGSGGYPETYDPRQRPWYTLAKQSGELVWAPPLIDAGTGQLVLTAAMPIYDKSGLFAGVTSIDIQILSVLNRLQTQLQVDEQAEGFIIRLAEPGGAVFSPGVSDVEPEILIVAYSGFQTQGRNWDSDIATETLMGESAKALASLIEDLAAQRDGILRMPYQGQDSLWVYGQLRRLGATLLYIMPYADIQNMAEEAQSFIGEATDEQIQLAGAASVILIVLVGVLAITAARSVTGPLRELARMASRLAKGDLDTRAPVYGRDEIGDVAEAFNSMVPQLRENMSVRQSMVLASEVQQKLLPGSAPVVEGLDIAGRSLYCDDTGGDYFDYLTLPQAGFGPRIGIAVADVTGHGVPSALTMTTVRALLRAKAHENSSLAAVVDDVNIHLTEDSTGGRFVTLVYLVIEPRTRNVRWVSAGHDPVIVYEPVQGEFSELPGDDIPLGIQGNWHFREGQRDTWCDGAIMVIGTDGVWEARNEAGDMFGKEALQEVIRRHAHRSAETICEAVTQALDAFRGPTQYRDDVTLVVAKFVPKDEEPGRTQS
ncbi:MAG: SpoIIE family protein phosphatase [Rhodospirillaceae bacterium]|jgi:phosphoserine phosphatase RsbU/P|nr:SpoIIE family protein phosphatase [Rhodospirillaceae bacterium]MBT5566431.1 SpoIIE family protein phosphatase [Rhodospirillaceae bacterium]MBT6088275.1 SpoIIE family protein phosphatase [Rhodospirillaceae bacterium]MBT6959804.1 SpoIIE family protein phosphatase [Rhodospirillaceae bacterium]